MINKKTNPIGWAMFMYELEDAKEHLDNLILEVTSSSDYNEANLRIDLGHIYSHLNRAWYRRDKGEDIAEPQWMEASRFPQDLEPI